MKEKEHWLNASAAWHSKIEGLTNSYDLQQQLASRIAENGCFYRFSTERFSPRREKWNEVATLRPLRHSTLSGGDDVIEIPLATALRPAFLPASVLAHVKRLGVEIEGLLQASNAYLLENRDLLSLFGDPVKGEFRWVNANAHLSPICQWLRIDYMWHWTDSNEIALNVVDINLLPGMSFINERLAGICADVFTEFGLCSHPQREQLFNIQVLAENMLAHFSKHCCTNEDQLRIAVLMRRFHGLGAEADLCVESLSKLERCKAEVFSPEALQSELSTHFPEHRNLDGIVRMSRPVSKHVTSGTRNEEDEAFRSLMQRLDGTDLLYPSFNAYLENHGWFYIWQTDAFADFAAEIGKSELLIKLKAHFPRTCVIAPDGRLLGPKEVKTLCREDLNQSVLKRGNSTGGQDLRILSRPSSGQLTKAYEFVKSTIDAGWVLQKIVPASREIFPIYLGRNSQSLAFVNGYMVHAAYFSGTHYLGGHAVMTPSSRKVHGGFDSYLLPIFPTP